MLTLIRCPFHPCATAVARKRPWSFCQKSRWQVRPKHAYTLDPTKSEWGDYAAVQARRGNLSGNERTRNSSGNTRPQSSELAESLWTDLGLKSGINVNELISTLKKQCSRGMNGRTFSQNTRKRGKRPLKSLLKEKIHFCCSVVLRMKLIQLYEIPPCFRPVLKCYSK